VCQWLERHRHGARPVAYVALALALAACVRLSSEPGPTLSAVPVRIAIAPLASTDWHSEQDPGDLRRIAMGWLDGWHGVTVASITATDAALAGEIAGGAGAPSFTLRSPIDGVDNLSTIAGVCAAARRIDVDALIVGTMTLRETIVRACKRKRLVRWHHDECAEWSEDVDSAEAELSSSFVVITTTSCGWTEVAIPPATARSRSPAENRARVWAAHREQVRRRLRDVVRTAPTRLHPGA
jgi:hypothetical protein